MLQMSPTNRNAGYCCTGSAGMSVQVTSGQCACLFYFLPTSCPGIIATGSADIFTTSSYVCNSYTRLSGMLQYPCFKRWHVCCSCTRPPGMSVSIKLNQHACLLELHLPADMFESVATDLQVHLHLPQTRSYVPILVPN